MKKIVTSIKQEEKTFCDVCGEEIDHKYISAECGGNDICHNCIIEMISPMGHGYSVCCSHLDMDSYKKIYGE